MTDASADDRRSAREHRPADHQDLYLLLDTLHERTGLDFRRYAFSSLHRRVTRAVHDTQSGSIAGLHQRIRLEDQCLGTLVSSLTVHTTAMFRDPAFFLLLRREVVPVLRTYPFLRFWVAGCSTGEEVYSLAILLREEGLLDRCRIYATDVSDSILQRAKQGVFPLANMRDYLRNYQQAGGTHSFSDYFTADAESAVFERSLREPVVFGTHNLVSEASFNEFHVILCRNVMIYFQRELQEHVHQLLHASLIQFGFLGLGRAETVRFTSLRECYNAVGERERLFRKIR